MTIDSFFKQHNNAAVAFSGGVDSAVLLFFAKRYAQNVKAYYVKSQFQPAFEYEDALKVAEILEIDLEVIEVDVLSNSEIVKNPENRCYYCKKMIFQAIINAAARDGIETVVDGTNATDDVNDRPGFKALKELGVISPLRDCGYTKKEIRTIAKDNKMPVFDKPSYACLATRIPTDTQITSELLEKTEKAENLLMNEGFRNFRIRYAEGDARLELGRKETELFNKNKEKVISLLTAYYGSVYLDSKERTDE